MKDKPVFEGDSLSDAEIIEKVLGGQTDYYALLVRRYNQRLYRTGLAILKDDSVVEDAMQVAYINAYENLSGFAHRSSFSTWITRILVHECIRMKNMRKPISISDENFEHLSAQKSKEADAASRLVNSELKKMLEDSILQLPEAYREVFVLREIEDLSVAETGECLSISNANVKVRLNRAKGMLREQLLKQYKKEEIFHFQLQRCDRMVENVMKQLSKATAS